MAAGRESEIIRYVALLRSRDSNKRQQAVNALIELTYDNPKNRIFIGRVEGAILSLINLLKDAKAEVKSGAACILGNLALNNTSNAIHISTKFCISTLITLLSDADIGTAQMAAWALANTACSEGEYAPRIREKNGIRLLHAHLKGEISPEGREAIGRAIAQLQSHEATVVRGASAYRCPPPPLPGGSKGRGTSAYATTGSAWRGAASTGRSFTPQAPSA